MVALSVVDGILEDANDPKTMIPGDAPMTKEVAQSLVQFVSIKMPSFSGNDKGVIDKSILVNWRNDNKEAFKRVQNPKPHFAKARQDLENILRADKKATAALQSVNMRQKDPAGYALVMGSVAGMMNEDPKFAAKLVEKLNANSSELQSILQGYKEAYDNGKIREYVAGIKGESASPLPTDPATVVAQPAAAHAPGNQDKKQKLPPRRPGTTTHQVTSTAAPAPAAAVPAAAPNLDGMTDEQIEALLKDPANKEFAGLIDQAQLRAKLKEAAKANPDIIKSLKDPGAVAGYMAQLKAGKVDAFLEDLGGMKPSTEVAIVKMDDIMAQAKEGLGSMMGMFGGLLEGFGLGGAGERGKGLLERLAAGFGSDPVKTAMKARTEMGEKIGDLLNSTDPEKRKYGEYVAKNMMAEHYAGHDQNAKYLLVGVGANLKKIGEIDEARKDGLVVDITQLKVEIDKDGKKFIQDPIEFKEAPSVQASVTSQPTDWEAERAARDQRLAQQGPDLNIPGMSPATTTV